MHQWTVFNSSLAAGGDIISWSLLDEINILLSCINGLVYYHCNPRCNGHDDEPQLILNLIHNVPPTLSDQIFTLPVNPHQALFLFMFIYTSFEGK